MINLTLKQLKLFVMNYMEIMKFTLFKVVRLAPLNLQSFGWTELFVKEMKLASPLANMGLGGLTIVNKMVA